MPKNYNDTYLYNKYPYEERLFKFLMTANQINTLDDSFSDVKYEFKKRQPSNYLSKILDSKNVVLLLGSNGAMLNKQFRVFCSKDPKTKSPDYKVFVDCTGLIVMDEKTGMYKCRMTDLLICNIINAMVTLIYHKAENKILSVNIMSLGMKAFSALFTYIVDYIAKISTIPSTKTKCEYLACMYFTENILGKEFDGNYKHVASKIVDISEREQDMIIIQTNKEMFSNLKTFIDELSIILKIPGLKIDNIVDRWMFLFGTNTVFGLEYFPALSAMLTDAYIGAYSNNQKTIEKVIGNVLVDYTKKILEQGSMIV